VRTVAHLHGGQVPPESDGYPESWFTPGHSVLYHYPNSQRADTLWYHDHTVGITRLNVYAGLAGAYLLRDAEEESLNLPRGPYELPLVIQDRTFQPNGQLFYPTEGISPIHPVWVGTFFGDTAVVNGKVWPYLQVEPRRYRLRLVNGSNSRFYKLSLSSGQPFHQIGADGGFLPRPVQLRQLMLAPGERADLLVDFAGQQGARIVLANDPTIPGQPSDLTQILQFRVELPLSGQDTSSLPTTLPALERLAESSASTVRDGSLQEVVDQEGRVTEMLLNGLHWDDPVTEKPKLNSVEIWRLINPTSQTHPMHLHLARFQVLDRQAFDVARYQATKQLVFTGSAVAPEANEAGWKDTVRVNAGIVTRIIIPFTGFTGTYMWHCHLLEHEDNEMMRPFQVVPS
jgi:spore coat protein A